jgi:hypothetical protein
MTRDQFHEKYRGRMLLFLTEAWAARAAQPSSLGSLIDFHALQLKRLLGEMYEDLQPQPKPASAPANGRPNLKVSS